MLLWFKTVPLRSTLHLCQEVALYTQILEQPENKIKMVNLTKKYFHLSLSIPLQNALT